IADWALTDANGTTNLLSGLTDANVGVGVNTVTLTLADNTGTTGPPTYSYSQAGGDNIRDSAGNVTINTGIKTATDTAVPVFMYATMLDANSNGYVDAIQVQFSETIQNPGVDTPNWSVSGVPSGGSMNSVFKDTASTMRIDLTEGAGARDTAVGSLQFSYNNSASSIKDPSNNLASSIPLTTPDDGAPPIIITATTGEATGTENGYIDTSTITYSENVTVSAGNGNLNIGNLTSNTLTGETYVSGSGGSTLIFSVINSENPNSWDTDELPSAIIYAQTGGAIDIKDTSAAANEALAQNFASTTDGARPLIVAARTGEASGAENGYIDLIKLTYSEPVTIPAGARTEFDTADVTSNTLTGENCDAGGCGSGTQFINISVTNSENPSAYDTHELPANITYNEAAATIEDLSPAQNTAINQTFAAITDGAAPWFTSITLTDTTSGSDLYSNSNTIAVTFNGYAAVPAEFMLAQSNDFLTNPTAWLAFTPGTTYAFTAGDGTRTVYAKIRDAAGNESITLSDNTIIDTTIPSVTVVQPDGGESVPAKTGYSYTIQWNASDANMAANPINIYLDTDGSQTFPTTIATNLPNTGSYNWNTTELDTSTARIKVTAIDLAENTNEDISNNDFTMDSTIPIVNVLDPTANEEWKGGGSQTIEWTVWDDLIVNPGPISIFYSTDNWVSSSTIATGLARGSVIGVDTYQGSYLWNPVDSITAAVQIRVVATDDSGKKGFNMTPLPIIIDSTPPNTGTIVIVDNSDWTNDKTPELQISTTENGADAMGSNDWMRLACTEAALGGASFISYTTTITNFDVTTGPGCAGGDGFKQVWVEFRDVAGNIQITHTSDSTNLETNANDVVANFKACTDATCAQQIPAPPSFSPVPNPYFDWSQPVTGPAPYEGYSLTLLPRTDPAPTACDINATDTFKQFTSPELASALLGTNGEMSLWIRAKDMAGNCGPATRLDINLDAFAPANPVVTVTNYEYLDASTTPSTYWVKPLNTFNIAVRYYEPVSMDKTYLSFNKDTPNNMTLTHDWNDLAGIFTENTVGGIFITPITGLESEGTGNGAALPSPSASGYFKYTWTLNPLDTTTSYYVRTDATDMLGNVSGWSTDAVYVNIDALRPEFALTDATAQTASYTITSNDQDIFINTATMTIVGSFSDAHSGGLQVELISDSGNNSGGALPNTWTVATAITGATWSYTTPSISGHNNLRFRGLDRVYNVSGSDEGKVGDVDIFMDTLPPLSISSSLIKSAVSPTRIDFGWTVPEDQGSGAGATNGTSESYGESQNWYRAGNVGIKILRTNLGTSAQTVARDWTTGTV
ncbi:MAG: hypothetical protein AB1599_10015, partial [Planctomycetota bacterium]